MQPSGKEEEYLSEGVKLSEGCRGNTASLVPSLGTTFRVMLLDDVIIQTFFCKILAELAKQTDQLFQNNSDFELLTKALKYYFFFFF